MFTLKLWLKLRNPPREHPLFHQIQTIHQERIPWFIWLIAIIGIPFLLIPALLLTALVYSIYWVISVSQVVQELRNKHQYDLLATLPIGNFGVIWLACVGAIHRNNSFNRLDGYGLWFVRIAIGCLIVNGIYNSVIDPLGLRPTNLEILLYLVFGIFLVLDHYSSVVLGCLIAMLVPYIIRNRFSSAIASPSILVLLQVLSYLMMIFLVTARLNNIDLENSDTIVLVARRIVELLVIFILSRELTIWMCWRLLIRQLGIPIREAWAVLDW